MKVLIIIPNDALGGAEQYLKMVASYFKEATVDIYFITAYDTKLWDDIKNNTNQHFCSTSNKFLGVLKFLFLSQKQKKEYDYVFTSHIYINALVGILLKLKILKTKKFIARESTSIFLRYKGLKLFLYKLAYKIGYKKIDLLICQTELMKNQLIQHFKSIEKKTKIVTIPNPLNFEYLLNERAKEGVNLPFEYIVSAGRFIPEKGFDLLINAFYHVKISYPNLKLILLGDGELKPDLVAQIKSLSLDNDIILPGHVNNVLSYFKSAKLCVVSSRIEGFPNVLLQMMSQNNNVVSTTCAGGIDKIEGIYLSKPNDAESLKIAIEKALSTSNSTSNRSKFDNYLSERDIDKFIKKIIAIT